jgi:hypothetical protein
MGETEAISTTEVSEVGRHTKKQMDVAEKTLANPKTKGEGIITKEETNSTIKTEEKITQTTINTNHNKQQHHKEAHTIKVEEPRLDKQANGALVAKS